MDIFTTYDGDCDGDDYGDGDDDDDVWVMINLIISWAALRPVR